MNKFSSQQKICEHPASFLEGKDYLLHLPPHNGVQKNENYSYNIKLNPKLESVNLIMTRKVLCPPFSKVTHTPSTTSSTFTAKITYNG